MKSIRIGLILVWIGLLFLVSTACSPISSLPIGSETEIPTAAPVNPEKITTEPETGIRYASDQVVVVFKSGVSERSAKSLISELGGSIIGQIPQIDTYQIQISSSSSVEEMVKKYEENDSVGGAFRNVIPEVTVKKIAPEIVPGEFDHREDMHWHLRQIKVNEAWDITKGSKEVDIAIVDDGLDKNNLEVDDKIVGGWNVLEYTGDYSPSPPLEKNYHGTRVALTAAAETDNPVIGINTAGVAWENELISIKVSRITKNGNPVWSLHTDAAGVITAVDMGAKIINCSWAVSVSKNERNDPYNPIRKAIQYAKGRIDPRLIVAAMNNRKKGKNVVLPADYASEYENVIAVAATDKQDDFYGGYNAEPTVAAPGYKIYTSNPRYPNDPNEIMHESGTSLATPQVSGLAALIWSLDYEDNQSYDFSPAEVREIIVESADDEDDGVDTINLGAGRINAYAALIEAKSKLDLTPKPGTIIEVINSPAASPFFELAWDGYFLWDRYKTESERGIKQIDPSTGNTVNKIPIPYSLGGFIIGLTWDGHNLWVALSTGTDENGDVIPIGDNILKIDPANTVIDASFKLTQSFFPGDLAWDGNNLVVSTFESISSGIPTVYIIDTAKAISDGNTNNAVLKAFTSTPNWEGTPFSFGFAWQDGNLYASWVEAKMGVTKYVLQYLEAKRRGKSEVAELNLHRIKQSLNANWYITQISNDGKILSLVQLQNHIALSLAADDLIYLWGKGDDEFYRVVPP